MPVPDQVRDDGSGIQNKLELLDSGFRRNDAIKKFRVNTHAMYNKYDEIDDMFNRLVAAVDATGLPQLGQGI